MESVVGWRGRVPREKKRGGEVERKEKKSLKYKKRNKDAKKREEERAADWQSVS